MKELTTTHLEEMELEDMEANTEVPQDDEQVGVVNTNLDDKESEEEFPEDVDDADLSGFVSSSSSGIHGKSGDAGVISIINTEGYGNRVVLSKDLLGKLDNPQRVQ